MFNMYTYIPHTIDILINYNLCTHSYIYFLVLPWSEWDMSLSAEESCLWRALWYRYMTDCFITQHIQACIQVNNYAYWVTDLYTGFFLDTHAWWNIFEWWNLVKRVRCTAGIYGGTSMHFYVVVIPGFTFGYSTLN